MPHLKTLLACIAAAAILAAAVGTASASRLSISNREVRLVWRPLILEAAGESVKCDVTLEVEFHSNTIRKTSNALIGNITRASLNNCIEGSGTILQASLPWHVTYKSYGGTLPRPTRVQSTVIGAAFRSDPPELPACLATTTTEDPEQGESQIEPNGLVTGLRADEAVTIPLSEGFGCGFLSARFIGLSRVTNLLGTANIAVRLI